MKAWSIGHGVVAIGVDIVTIFVALELRHYLTSAAQLVGIPTGAEAYSRMAAQAVSCGRGVQADIDKTVQ